MIIRNALLSAILVLVVNSAQAQPQALSLGDAIQAAMENNLNVIIAGESAIQARQEMRGRKADLFPSVNGSVSYTNQSVNLAARGIQFGTAPTRVGPFGVGDVRVALAQPVLDVALVRQYRSSERSLESTEFSALAARNNAVAVVSRLYFDVQRADALVDSAVTQVVLARDLVDLARVRVEAGVGTSLEVARAESRLAADEHNLLITQNERRTAELSLSRAMGQRLDVSLELTDELGVEEMPGGDLSLETAMDTALERRPEWQAQLRAVHAADLRTAATLAERLPSIRMFADYGDMGNTDFFLPTHTVGLQVTLPIFDSGRRSARLESTASRLRQEEARRNDLRDQIEMEIRIALSGITLARELLAVSERRLDLANQEFALARVRFEAEVSPQIEVVEAQSELADARSARVQALYALRVAQIDFDRAVGTIRE